MARTSNKEQQPDVENFEEKDEAPVAKVNTTEKKVRIRTSDEIDCFVSNVHYQFKKDKEVLVPSDVASILCFAGKAYRL